MCSLPEFKSWLYYSCINFGTLETLTHLVKPVFSSGKYSTYFTDILEKLIEVIYVNPFPGCSDGKESSAMQEVRIRSLGQEEPLEKGMATRSSILD